MNRKIRVLILLLVFLLASGCSTEEPETIPVRQPDTLLTAESGMATSIASQETATPQPTSAPLPNDRLHMGDQALFDGDWEKALGDYQSVLAATNDPKLTQEAILGSARSYVQGNDDLAAIALLEDLLRDHPEAANAASAHFELAEAYLRQEKYAEAIEEYSGYLAKKPGAIDAYIFAKRAEAAFSAGDYPSAANDYQAAIGAPSVMDGISLRLKLALTYTLAGDLQGALRLYEEVFLQTQDEYTRALIDLRKGQVFTEMGLLENAQAAYLDAVNNYPKAYDSYSALVALVEAGVEVDSLQRGIIDYHAGMYGPAATALDSYLQKQPADPGTAHYYYGLTFYAQGNYQAAIDQWDALIAMEKEHPHWAEAWGEKAYTQWFDLEQPDAAIQTLLDFAQRDPGSPRAAEFLFEAASIAERANQLNRAIEIWEKLTSDYPGDAKASRARFLASISRYRLEDFEGAELAFQRYLSASASLEDKAAGNFWLGKTYARRGSLESAKTAWQTAAALDPTSYYSERARDLLNERASFSPPEGYDLVYDLNGEKIKAADWVKTKFNLAADVDLLGPGDLVNDPYLRRGLELWEIGMLDEARGEFEVLRMQAQEDPARTFRLANLFLDLGAYRPAIMAARQVLNLAGMDDAGTLGAPIYFSHIRFGTYYSDLVLPLAQEYDIHPLFLFSLIRQESLFEGFVRSSAGARGLMQIIPSTGDDIASQLDWPADYQSTDLYRPLVSLHFGVDYLNRQRELFEGDMYAALAAYNGGPGNALTWIELGKGDPDLFLETIRYEETRLYIRRIYENFAIYRFIYDRTS